jgi:hypothetical protein
MFFAAATLMTAFGGALAAAIPFNPGTAIAMATIDSFSIGALVVPSPTLVLYARPDRYIGTTAALSLSVRFLGGSIGTAIYFNIFNTQIKSNLPTYMAQAAIKAGLKQKNAKAFEPALTLSKRSVAQAVLARVPNVTPQIVAAGALAARWTFADSLKYVWYAMIPFGVICMGCCLAISNVRQYMSSRVAVVSVYRYFLEVDGFSIKRQVIDHCDRIIIDCRCRYVCGYWLDRKE